MQTNLECLDLLRPIELSDMDAIRLMNRVDTKYLTDAVTLGLILGKAAQSGYLAFEINGKRVNEYRSMYYDTPSLQMYLDHHNRRLVRQKLRTRCYVASGRTFLELKNKNNHGRTGKKRLEIEPRMYCMESLTDSLYKDWLDGRMRYPIDGMMPSLETSFSRITLVNPQRSERTTIDFNLDFHNVRNEKSVDMDNMVIIELKQDGFLPSRLREILLECRVKRLGLSKYCIGTAMTDETVKMGNFKEKLMLIEKMKRQI